MLMFIHDHTCMRLLYYLSFSFMYNIEVDINCIYTSILLQWSM